MLKHFAFTDIHGKDKLFDKAVNEIQNRSKGESYRIFYLGDAADRGTQGYKIMKKLLFDPHITYLYGNHEDMFIGAAQEIQKLGRYENMSEREIFSECVSMGGSSGNRYIDLCVHNGGFQTLKAWVKDVPIVQRKILQMLKSLPVFATYNEYDMCHAGCLRSDWMENEEKMIWARDHFDEPWFDGRILVHGHTPHETAKTTVFENSQKINLDSGTCFTGVVSILDLDTRELFCVS